MRNFARFWWTCIRAGTRGSVPFANDWQWSIGNPTVAALTPTALAILAIVFGSSYITAEHPILGPFVLALAAFVITWLFAAAVGALREAPRLYYLVEQRADDLASKLAPKIRLFLKADPFGQTTGIEIAHAAGGEQLPHIQVCVEPITEATVREATPFITKIEHRSSEQDTFTEIIGEPRSIDWAWEGQKATLAKGRPLRFSLVSASSATKNLYDVTKPDRSPNNLLIFYSEIAKSGEYRYTVHVEALDIAPARAYVYVKWLPRGYPRVRLEAIGDTFVTPIESVPLR